MVKEIDMRHKNTLPKIWNIDVSLRRDQKITDLTPPPGFTCDRDRSMISEVEEASNNDHSNLMLKRSWDIALGPMKGIPMNAFIMYMAGNTISIFPIMMVGMMFFRPIQALMSIRTTMSMLEHSNQYLLQIFMFTLGNCLALLLAVYKCNSMGLLPTHASDWLAFSDSPVRMEFVDGGLTL